jgi:thiol:disulfide interchange protein DsbD
MLSGLVVGPCTAPVLGGLLLYVGASGHPVFGATLLFTFALGMGLPVVVLGTFAGLLANLPKAGEWTVKVQRAFGVLLLLAGEYLLLEAGKRLV